MMGIFQLGYEETLSFYLLYRVRTVMENLGKSWDLSNGYFQACKSPGEEEKSPKFWKSHGNVFNSHVLSFK